MDSLTAMEWFHENVDRIEAENLLRDDGRDGSFIVRISKAGQSGSKTSPYSLSVYRAQKYYHFKIMLTGRIDYPRTVWIDLGIDIRYTILYNLYIITHVQSYEGDEYHLDGKTNDYFTSVVELVEFYRRNSLMKVKPTESEFQTITGRPSHARKGSFLGVQG